MRQSKPISPAGKVLYVILGAVMIIMGVALFIHDAGYIITGKTLDLNEIISNGGEPPRDKYVTYACEVPMGDYAESQEYLSGLIPIPGTKTREFALLLDNGMVVTAEVKSKKDIEALEEYTKIIWNTEQDDLPEPLAITGCVNTLPSDSYKFLEEYMSDLGFDGSDGFMTLTHLRIDTTKTRVSLLVTYSLFTALGVFIAFTFIQKLRNGN